MADQQVVVIAGGLRQLVERVVTKITLDVTANLIETTPVDTGWARANWTPSIGAAFERGLSGLDKAPTSASANTQRAFQESAIAAVSGYKLQMGNTFVSNNVPYILELNEGKSSQAPAAFVQMAIMKAVTQDIRGIR